MWLLHFSVFWQVFPHGSISRVHGAWVVWKRIDSVKCKKLSLQRVSVLFTSLPHGHDRNWPAGHGPQSPLWHFTLHRCLPHSNNLLHIFSHDQTALLQFRSWVLLPHTHFCWLFFVHGGHSAWQTPLHVWMPQASNFEHYCIGIMNIKQLMRTKKRLLAVCYRTLFPHFHDSCTQRMVRKLDLPHSHEVAMVCEQGGHGPGWQSIMHWCEQRPYCDFSGFSQSSPHECGTSHRWLAGFNSFLQKQM